ncbi:MAG: hypothetical protein Q9207_008361 [Kuettlingeria erythrocarpa]
MSRPVAMFMVVVAALQLVALVHGIHSTGLSLDFKVERNPVSLSNRRRDLQQGLGVPLDYRELSYFANVSIGTPKQFFSVNIDTGHSGFWIPASNSSMCRDQPLGCQFTSSYNINQSLTASGFQRTFNTDFSDGSTNQGVYVSDLVSIAGVDIGRVPFGLVQRAKDLVEWLGVAGGVLGIGYDEPDVAGPGILTKLVQAGLIASKAYSIWLHGGPDSRCSGSLLFGAIDESKFEPPLRSVPIVRAPPAGGGNPYNKTLMTVQLTSITLSSSSADDNDDDKAGSSSKKFHILPPDSVTHALLITSMSYVGLPTDIAKAVHAAAGVLQDSSSTGGTPYVACNLSQANSTFTFGFGGKDGPAISVPVGDFVYGQDDNVTFADGSAACMFGMAYVVFDLENRRVALAQAKGYGEHQAGGGGDIKPITNGTDGIPGVASHLSSIPYPQSYVDEFSAWEASVRAATATATTTASGITAAAAARTGGSATATATDTDTEAPWIAYPTLTSSITGLPPKALFTGLSAYRRG